MRSSRSSHIWLIQPPDPHPAVLPIDAAGGDSVRFSPAWDLLCLQAFILERTGHTCDLIDTRLHENIESALARLKSPPSAGTNKVAVLHGTLHNLGSTASIVQHIKAKHPDVDVVLCGPLASSFPEVLTAIPGVNYGLRGDAETILRNLLDFCDIEHRLKLVPGLILPGQPLKPPYWMPTLNAISLPDWLRTRWSQYQQDLHANGVRIEVRLSRGSPGMSVDRPFPIATEPMRIWPMHAMATLVQKCPGHGISEVFLADPPGFWTTERIMQWCSQLDTVRNSQPWSFQMVPRTMTDEELFQLSYNICRRIELIIPALHEPLRSDLGFDMSADDLKRLLQRMIDHKIRPQLVYWIEGPEAPANEAETILQHIRAVDATEFSMYPFPLHLDSPLYQSCRQKGMKIPALSDWLDWIRKPGSESAPADLWSGAAGVPVCMQKLMTMQRKIVHNPWVKLLRFLKKQRSLFSQQFIKKQPNFSVRNPDINAP